MKQHISDIFMLENLFCLVINEFFYLCNQYTYIHRYLLFIELEGTVGVKPTYQDFADPDLIRSDTCPIIIYFRIGCYLTIQHAGHKQESSFFKTQIEI